MSYWSCTKLADLVRGTDKLPSGTSEEWSHWRRNAKQAHPFRFWLAESLLDNVQDVIKFVPRKIHDFKIYCRNRFVTKTHALCAESRDISRGQWIDTGNRFLPCLFAGLVDFVEVELAWNWINFGDKESSKYAPKFYNRTHWRSREAGLAQLEWQCSLVFDDTWVSPSNPDYGKPTPQALSAMQIRELYLWWTETYRNRRDPYEVSGYDAFWESIRKDTEDSDMDALDRVLYRKMSPEIEEESRRLYDEINKIEQDYNKEEEEMMVALIRLRESLWT